MSIRVVICYGAPTDPAAFDQYYTSVHIPLAEATPGLREYTWGKVVTADGSEPLYYAIAHLVFPDEPTYEAAMASPEMAAAGADLANFASGGVTIITQHEIDVLALP